MCFGGFHPAKNVEVPPTPVGGAPPENGKPVGILTERDILKRVCPEKLCKRNVTAEEIMSRPLVHIEADAGLGQASSLMTLKDVRRLLVVDKGKIVGIVTQKDIMRGSLETFMSLASI
jgi:CBS domain-containing protein